MDNKIAKTKVPKNREKELQQDVEVLRKIMYETIEKSILLQQRIKDIMPDNNSKEKSILQAIKKMRMSATSFSLTLNKLSITASIRTETKSYS